MLVIITEEHLISPTQVCQTCLLADRSGQPRWHNGKLCCGNAVQPLSRELPPQYECCMGFRLVNIESSS
jgi:hypothetical protein